MLQENFTSISSRSANAFSELFKISLMCAFLPENSTSPIFATIFSELGSFSMSSKKICVLPRLRLYPWISPQTHTGRGNPARRTSCISSFNSDTFKYSLCIAFDKQHANLSITGACDLLTVAFGHEHERHFLSCGRAHHFAFAVFDHEPVFAWLLILSFWNGSRPVVAWPALVPLSTWHGFL